MADNHYSGNARAIRSKFTGSLEKNNHLQGQSEGMKVRRHRGPAAKSGVLPGNPTNDGGINRATKDKST